MDSSSYSRKVWESSKAEIPTPILLGVSGSSLLPLKVQGLVLNRKQCNQPLLA